MEEIWFRLTTQLELLQVQTSNVAREGQQILIEMISQSRQLLHNIYDEQYPQQIKEFGMKIFALLQRGVQQLRSYFVIDVQQLQSEIRQLTKDVTKREVTFLLCGMVIGTLIGTSIGYNVGYKWNFIPRNIQHMKAIICHRYIGSEGVSMIEDAEVPIIKWSNEMLIQVVAASLHDIDLKICSGYSKTYRKLLNSGNDLPIQLGRDCAGIVVDIGRSVINFDIGDEVFLAVPSWASGTMADFIVVPENIVAKRPKLVSFKAAASLPYSGCLAWDALVNQSVVEEGNARGRRILVCGGNTPIGCILIQLVKIWGGYVVTTCRPHAVSLMQALGADHVIAIGESKIQKELELLDRYDVIFYTGGVPIEHKILKQHLMPHGSFVSTVPENLTSDSLGFVFGHIFAGCLRVKLVFQSIFGMSSQHWREGSKLKTSYLRGLRELVDTDQLQIVVDRIFVPQCIDQALQHISDLDALGSTVIKFK